MRTYRHALGAILLLIHHWIGALDRRLHGGIGERILADMYEESARAWAPFETPLLRTSIWLFKHAEQLMPEYFGYEEPDYID